MTIDELKSSLPRLLSRREAWPQVFNELGFNGIGVELGVLRGEFSSLILAEWKGAKLYLVDSWRHHPGLVDCNNPDPEGHLLNLVRTIQNTYHYGDRAVVLREESVSAAKLFQDRSLDFVYLDAAHDYESVLRDLEAWAPKVRIGGMICGDDFADGAWVYEGPEGVSAPTIFGVKSAVSGYCARNGLKFHLSEGEKPQWWIFKESGAERKQVSYLVLDYNRPEETRACLKSIRENSRFEYQTILLSNGGEQGYIWDLYREGWIDRLLLNRTNNGLGYGTTDLFRYCDTEYAIYVQNDQIMHHPLEQTLLDGLIATLERDRRIGAFGLAGYCAGVDVYSERPHLINVEFYNSIPDKPNGGCGPHYEKGYNEGYIQKYFKDHGLHYFCGEPYFFSDNGTWTIRETPCGGISRINIYTRQLWWDRLPKAKCVDPDLSDREWELSIEGKWVGGTVPESRVGV
jgi:hypothetical protein